MLSRAVMWWEKMPQEGEDISGKRLVARKRREASRSIPLQSIHPYPQPLFKILRATFILLIGDKNNYVRLLIIITTFSSSASGLSSGDKKKPTSHTSLSLYIPVTSNVGFYFYMKMCIQCHTVRLPKTKPL